MHQHIVIVRHDHLSTSIEEHIHSPESLVDGYDHTSHKSPIQTIIVVKQGHDHHTR